MDEIVKILLCEGGDVEQWLEPRNKLFVFTIDPLSLTLSCTLSIASYCHIIYMLVLFVCASLVLNHESFI